MHEITASGTANLIAKNQRIQEAGYSCFGLRVCPARRGLPKRRIRYFTFGYLSCEGVRFHGSENEFWDLFARRSIISGNVYLVMEDERTREVRERAALKGNHLPTGVSATEVPLELQFKNSVTGNVDDHDKNRVTNQGTDCVFIFDAEQSTDRTTSGPCR